MAAWQAWGGNAGTTVPGLAAVIGHRGAAGLAPENTLPALAAAAALGLRWVEFDVMLTRDAVPVLIHDDRLERTSDGAGAVAATDHAAIGRLDAGSWFGPAFAGTRVPTLARALAFAAEHGLGVNLEIKPAPGQDTRTAEVAVAAVRRHWRGGGLLLSSFSREALAVAARLAPDLPRGLLAETLPDDWEAALRALRCTTLNLDHENVDDRLLAELRARGLPVLLYTVNDPARARHLLAAGAAALFTDRPDLMLAAGLQ